MNTVSYCDTSMYQPKWIKDYPPYLDYPLIERRCKEDCYWYEEEHDMGATIPFCKLRKGLDPIEYEDCAKCGEYHSKYKRIKADSIRAMSDEELAEFFSNTCIENLGKSRCDSYERCYDCMLAWLKEEVKT